MALMTPPQTTSPTGSLGGGALGGTGSLSGAPPSTQSGFANATKQQSPMMGGTVPAPGMGGAPAAGGAMGSPGAYQMSDYTKMIDQYRNTDPAKAWGIYNTLTQNNIGGYAGGLQGAISSAWGRDAARDWVNSMETQYGSATGFDPKTGRFAGAGNAANLSGTLEGWDPSRMDANIAMAGGGWNPEAAARAQAQGTYVAPQAGWDNTKFGGYQGALGADFTGQGTGYQPPAFQGQTSVMPSGGQQQAAMQPMPSMAADARANPSAGMVKGPAVMTGGPDPSMQRQPSMPGASPQPAQMPAQRGAPAQGGAMGPGPSTGPMPNPQGGGVNQYGYQNTIGPAGNIQGDIQGGQYFMDQARQAYMDQANRSLDPQWSQAQSDLESTLLNRGLSRGSEAWNREAENLSRSKNDAYDSAMRQAIMLAGQEGSRMQGMDLSAGNFHNAAQQQNWNQLMGQAGLWNSALGQGQGMDLGRFQAYNSADVASRAQDTNAFNAYNAANIANRGMTNQEQLQQFNMANQMQMQPYILQNLAMQGMYPTGGPQFGSYQGGQGGGPTGGAYAPGMQQGLQNQYGGYQSMGGALFSPWL